jgi:hypothetical protein
MPGAAVLRLGGAGAGGREGETICPTRAPSGVPGGTAAGRTATPGPVETVPPELPGAITAFGGIADGGAGLAPEPETETAPGAGPTPGTSAALAGASTGGKAGGKGCAGRLGAGGGGGIGGRIAGLVEVVPALLPTGTDGALLAAAGVVADCDTGDPAGLVALVTIGGLNGNDGEVRTPEPSGGVKGARKGWPIWGFTAPTGAASKVLAGSGAFVSSADRAISLAGGAIAGVSDDGASGGVGVMASAAVGTGVCNLGSTLASAVWVYSP